MSRIRWLSEVAEYLPQQVREGERSAIPGSAVPSGRRSAAVGPPEVPGTEGAGDGTDDGAAFGSSCEGPAMVAAMRQS
jgi:hypothetical protein